MQSRISFFVLALALAAQAMANERPSSSVEHFEYRPERITPGTLYSYTKSNRDGSRPARVEVYVASRSRLEVHKIEVGATTAYVVGEMDWSTFSGDHLEGYNILPDGSRPLRAVFDVDHAAPAMRVKVHALDGLEGTVPVRHFPVHEYSFELLTLNFSLRHLKDPKRPFRVGLVERNPAFHPQRDPRPLVYSGEAEVRFVGEAACRSDRCLRYRFHGAGLDGGSMWVEAEQMHVVRIEIAKPTNSDWQDFKLELKSIEHLDPAAWQQRVQDDWRRQVESSR